MAEPHHSESSGTGKDSVGSSDSTVEINIKTLDSQMYSFHVDKNMPVSLFKENIASKTGVPVEQQRLIFRGKVLKDNHLLSDYHVDNGHTLHLVARQSSQPQSSSGTNGGEATSNAGDRAGQEAIGGLPRSVGQVSHSVVLGTFNVGDQVENSVPDLSRVIGAVLNSFGMGNHNAANGSSGIQPTMMASQGNEAAGRQSTTGYQTQIGTQSLPGQAPSSQSVPQVMHIPLGGAIPMPSFNQPIPDSLHTLSEFMNRMELTFSQNGNQSNQPMNDTGVLPSVNLPTNLQGVPTPEALVAVLRHAERLFSGHAIGAISRIAGRVEQEGGSNDPLTRSQIQAETMQLGLVMQHLGALLLELGRTMLALRMGQSSLESSVNSGPAVYISSSGPNPIMVQPSPLQTRSLFGSSVAPPMNPGAFASGGVGVGPNPRHVTSLAIIVPAVGPRTNNGEGMQGGRGTGTASGDSAQARVLPVRNIVTSAVSSQPSVVSVPGAVQNVGNLSQQTATSVPLSTIMAEMGSQIRNFVANMESENQGSSANQESLVVQGQSSASGVGSSNRGNDVRSLLDTNRDLPLHGRPSDTESHVGLGESQKTCNKEYTKGAQKAETSSSSSEKGADNKSCTEKSTDPKDVADSSSGSNLGVANPDGARSIPLGLGLGGLEPKRRSRPLNSRGTSGASATSTTPNNHSQQPGSLFLDQRTASTLSAEQLATAGGVVTGRTPMEGLSSGDQNDTANVMSQVLNSPALDGLLAGVSRQTGVGSPNVLRNMLGQLTQNPAMMNTVNQIAQQMDGQDFGSMFTGPGAGRGGGIDLSRMIQQMMPIVSQALGGGSTLPPQALALEREVQPTHCVARPSRDEKHNEQNSQIDLQQAVERIENEDPPEEILRSIAESVLSSHDYGNGGVEGLVNELCAEGLASELVEMLRRDIARRVEDETDPAAEGS